MSKTLNHEVNTYLPTWRHDDVVQPKVCVQATQRGNTICGHSMRAIEECWPHLSSRDCWENSQIYQEMVEEAIENRQRQIDALTK